MLWLSLLLLLLLPCGLPPPCPETPPLGVPVPLPPRGDGGVVGVVIVVVAAVVFLAVSAVVDVSPLFLIWEGHLAVPQMQLQLSLEGSSDEEPRAGGRRMPQVGATVLPPRPPGGASGSACHHPSKRRFAEAFGGAHGEGVQCAEEISSNDSQDEDGVCTAWESSSDGEVDGLAPTTPTIPRDLGSAPAILNDLPCAFRWAFRLPLALSAVFGERQMRAQLCGSPLLMRTHFSGLGTAEVAIDALGRAARHFLPKPIRLLSASMCEKTHSLRQTLRRRRPEACVFGNICDLFDGIDQNLA